ncbi:Protein of unknown function [Gryllus bimaculatus]|nr:Protein of unknown function [Gryllus bimaculatus]
MLHSAPSARAGGEVSGESRREGAARGGGDGGASAGQATGAGQARRRCVRCALLHYPTRPAQPALLGTALLGQRREEGRMHTPVGTMEYTSPPLEEDSPQSAGLSTSRDDQDNFTNRLKTCLNC